MDQNTHLGSLLVPATFLGLVGPSPVIRVCERGAFDLVILTKSKAPRLHTFVIVQVLRRGLCGFLLAETTQNGSLKCSFSHKGGLNRPTGDAYRVGYFGMQTGGFE